jgi:nucleoside phosphorylase
MGQLVRPGTGEVSALEDLGLTQHREIQDRMLTERFGHDLPSLEASCKTATARPVTTAQAPRRARSSLAPTIGIVTAMPVELAAMQALMDEGQRANIQGDPAHYVIGTLLSRSPNKPHRVVLTQMGDTGNDAAAGACTNLARSFESVGHVLLVGIAAGVPDPPRPERHVRLGDIVVSTWGIVDYDHIVDSAAGPQPRQPFPRPSRLLTHSARWLEAGELRGERPWEYWIDLIAARFPAFARPPAATDLLYLNDSAEEPTAHPDPGRSGHGAGQPKVHYGNIGSGDRALRNISSRDELARKHNLIAFEMEGKGFANASFANDLNWLVIRGISDYGDKRTGSQWRGYAALAAAAYARALLAECPPLTCRGGRPVGYDVTRQ